MVCSGEERQPERAATMSEEEAEEERDNKQQPPRYSFNQPFLVQWDQPKQLRGLKQQQHQQQQQLSTPSHHARPFSFSGPDRNFYQHHHGRRNGDGVGRFHNNNVNINGNNSFFGDKGRGLSFSGDRSRHHHVEGGDGLIKNRGSSSSSAANGLRVHDFRQEFNIPRRGAAAAAAAAVEEVEGIDAVREKLVFDLRKEADKMKQAIFKTKVSGGVNEADDQRFPAMAAEVVVAAPPPQQPAAVVEQEVARPWNLRTRRTAEKASPAPARDASPALVEGTKPSQVRGERRFDKVERAKFSVGLKKKEIEDDFMAMVGHKPIRRPKKRPRAVQKALDVLFPGLWLTEVTVDDYKVPEENDNAKR